jgi:hypothetical protein
LVSTDREAQQRLRRQHRGDALKDGLPIGLIEKRPRGAQFELRNRAPSDLHLQCG